MDFSQPILSASFVLLGAVATAFMGLVVKRMSDVYDKKKETIYEALHLVSSCYSKLAWTKEGEQIEVFKDKISDVELTIQIRKIHERLILSCSPSVVKAFLDCIIPYTTEDLSPTDRLNIFRQECLRELRFLSLRKIKLDEKRAFIGAFNVRRKKK